MIAVVLSVYKNSKVEWVKECLESIYNQYLKGDIFLRIDGEISEDLKKYLYSQKDNFEVFIEDSINRGIVYTYNQLFKEALNRGYKFIVRMDSDDIMEKDRIKLQIGFLEKNPQIGIVGGYIKEFGEYEKVVKYPLTHEDMLNFFKKRVPIANVTTTFRRNVFEKIGFYPESEYNEDTLMWVKAFKNDIKFANLDKILVKVRSSRDYLQRRRGIKKAFSDLKDRFYAAKELNFGIDSYLYATAVFLIQVSPGFIQKLAYKYLR